MGFFGDILKGFPANPVLRERVALAEQKYKDLEQKFKALETENKGLKEKLNTLTTQNEGLKQQAAERTVSDTATKPKLQWGCYKFKGEDGLFCPGCYDSKGKKHRAIRKRGGIYACTVCKVELG